MIQKENQSLLLLLYMMHGGFWKEWVNKIHLMQELRESLLNIGKNQDYQWVFKEVINIKILYSKGIFIK